MIDGRICAATWSTSASAGSSGSFKWAVAEELVPPSVFHGLQAVGWIACRADRSPRNGADQAGAGRARRRGSAVRLAARLGHDPGRTLDRHAALRSRGHAAVRHRHVRRSLDLRATDHKNRWRGKRRADSDRPEGPGVAASRSWIAIRPRTCSARRKPMPGGTSSVAWPRAPIARRRCTRPSCGPGRRQAGSQATKAGSTAAGPLRHALLPEGHRLRLRPCQEGRCRDSALAPEPAPPQPRHRSPEGLRRRGRSGDSGTRHGPM